MLLVEQQERHLAYKKLSGGMLAWLCVSQGADLHMAQLMPLPLTISCSSKSRLVFPLWYRITRVVSDKIQQQQQQQQQLLLLLLLLPFYGSRTASRTIWVSQYQKGKTNLDLL